jgi:hypothetical protein
LDFNDVVDLKPISYLWTFKSSLSETEGFQVISSPNNSITVRGSSRKKNWETSIKERAKKTNKFNEEPQQKQLYTVIEGSNKILDVSQVAK